MLSRLAFVSSWAFVVLFGRTWSGVGGEKRDSGPILSYKYDINPLLLMLLLGFLYHLF